nr:MAG TPA: hypothetical protein [Caudoviricetes sp.]
MLKRHRRNSYERNSTSHGYYMCNYNYHKFIWRSQ